MLVIGCLYWYAYCWSLNDYISGGWNLGMLKRINKESNVSSCNKELDRKSYAIKGQEILTSSEFGLAMALYLGKEPDYVKILVKNFI